MVVVISDETPSGDPVDKRTIYEPLFGSKEVGLAKTLFSITNKISFLNSVCAVLYSSSRWVYSFRGKLRFSARGLAH